MNAVAFVARIPVAGSSHHNAGFNVAPRSTAAQRPKARVRWQRPPRDVIRCHGVSIRDGVLATRRGSAVAATVVGAGLLRPLSDGTPVISFASGRGAGWARAG